MFSMYIVVNDDLKMGKGKIAAQVGHAVSDMYWTLINGKPITSIIPWKQQGETKIVLKASSEQIDELIKTTNPPIIIHDAGHTQVPEYSLTVIAYYPMRDGSNFKDFKLL